MSPISSEETSTNSNSKLEERVKKLVDELSHENFQVREKASRRLVALADDAVPALISISKTKLNVETKMQLDKVMGLLKSHIDRYLQDQRNQKRLDWFEQTMMEPYRTGPYANKKWDSDAEKAIRMAAQRWDLMGINAAPSEIVKAAQKAIAAGCNDPILFYIEARLQGDDGVKWEKLTDKYIAAAKMMEKSNHHALRKIWSLTRGAQNTAFKAEKLDGKSKKEFERFMNLALDQFTALGKYEYIPSGVIEDAAHFWILVHMHLDRERIKGVEIIVPVLAKALPDSPVSLNVKGRGYIDYAWDIRQDDWDMDIPKEKQKIIDGRLAVAEKALLKAHEMDPENPVAAIEMMAVELGQGRGITRLNKWFGRALEADLDSYRACSNKLYYLDPKWHGSENAMVKFGRKCFLSKNWEGRLPFILVDAHIKSAEHYGEKDEKSYFVLADVWNDIQVVYNTYLKFHPDSHWDRTKYMELAARAGKWDIAVEQFKILGDKICPAAFRSMEDYKKSKKKLDLLSRNK